MQIRFGGTVVRIDRKQLSVVTTVAAIVVFMMLYVSRGVERWDNDLPEPIRIDSVLNKRSNEASTKSKPDTNQVLRFKTVTFKTAMGTVSETLHRDRLQAARGVMAPHRPPDVKYNINVTKSDLTSLDRNVPDTRPKVCATIPYNISSLNPVSIIIPFFNEAPTMLLRAIHSVLNRSPAELIHEIILVDDMSYDAPLKEPLERYLALLPKVRLIRHTERSGLIVARMIGARNAKAPTIVFLDAHVEVNVGWLEPMLIELKNNPKQIIQPFIDGIDKETLEYTAPQIYFKGSLSWDLRYTWLKMPDHEQASSEATGQPFFSQTLMGCAIAADKDYFMKMGAFDEGMRVWGGENLELAFRIWMCGGIITTSPCSRVGHVFKQSPNKFDGTKGTKEETVHRNLMRVADVWMDGLKKYFYATTLAFDYKRFKFTPDELVSLKERMKVREQLKCRNFDWYLHNVAPEMYLLNKVLFAADQPLPGQLFGIHSEEPPPMNSLYFGEIMNLQTRACWEVTDDYYIGMTYFCYEHKVMPKNYFSITDDGLLRYRDKCVKVIAPRPYLIIAECPAPNTKDVETFGIWQLINKGPMWGWLQVKLRNERGDFVHWCVNQVTNAMPEHKGEQMPQLAPCDDKDLFLNWSWTYVIDFSLVPEYLNQTIS